MKKIMIIAAITAGAWTLNAQPAQGNPGGSPTPFGFVEILALAGAAYGGKKALDKRKNKESESES